MAKQKPQSEVEDPVLEDPSADGENGLDPDEDTLGDELETDFDEAGDEDVGIDLELGDVQCSGREASIRRAIEERREARRMKDDLDYLDMDD